MRIFLSKILSFLGMAGLLLRLALLPALMAAFPAQARMSPADPSRMVSLALESCHTASIGYDDAPATWAYDVDIPCGMTNAAIASSVTIQANHGYDFIPVSSMREDSSPRGPPPEFGRLIAAEGTETFYRTMSQANYDALAATGKLPATSETFISPSLEYAQQYNGVTVQFNVQAGTQNALMGMGVRNSAAGFAGTAYEGLPIVQSGWGSSSAFFKWESENLVNIGLGRGSALNTFNNNIVNFNLVPKP